jgi:hypothetical protein
MGYLRQQAQGEALLHHQGRKEIVWTGCRVLAAPDWSHGPRSGYPTTRDCRNISFPSLSCCFCPIGWETTDINKVNSEKSEADRNNRTYFRASNTILKGVSVARRKRVNPPFTTTSRIFFSPACAPRPAPTSWASEAGTQQMVEAE